MIVEALMAVVHGVVGFVVGLFAGIDLPDWADQAQEALGTLSTYISGMGVWINWPLAVLVAGVVVSTFIGCLVVKIVLRIIAFLPMVGGAG